LALIFILSGVLAVARVNDYLEKTSLSILPAQISANLASGTAPNYHLWWPLRLVDSPGFISNHFVMFRGSQVSD
ncbi:MAG TPA: hypothetical protein DDZ55_10790, partial [Firmicutes bacterium]|nr:hypothetical protein [Bacillota bacterium]